MRNVNSLHVIPGVDQVEAEKKPFTRALPSALAVVPVSMLFGILAYRADWSILEILAASVLGFTGSGQLALLPLADSNTSFLTMLLICASINSRYIPIALTTQHRLPSKLLSKWFAAHMLGDEAYATEKASDSTANVFTIRFTIFFFWVVSGVAGGALSKAIPDSWISGGIHLGYPASVVLVYLSVTQIKTRMHGGYTRPALLMMVCLALAAVFVIFLGPTYFWVPSVLLTTLILHWFRYNE